MKKQKRNELIHKLRKEGKTLQSIGEMFDITRERVRQICAFMDEIDRERLSTGKDLTQ